MPIVTSEDQELLKEIQATLPWISDGVVDNSYHQSGSEIRTKLEPHKSDIERFLEGATPKYVTTLALLLGLDKLVFTKWASDVGVALPGAVQPARNTKPRTQAKTPPAEAERFERAAPPTPADKSPTPEPSLGESLADAAAPLKAQMELVQKHRLKSAALEVFHSTEEATAAALLEKYEELIALLVKLEPPASA